MSERSDIFGVYGVTEGGSILLDVDAVGMDRWNEPFSQRIAYLWLCAHGPVRAQYSRLGRAWRWPSSQARKFIYQMAGAGLVRITDKKIVAVPVADAVPSASEESWTALRAFVLARDGYACVYCSSKDDLHCDHVLPRSRGGVDHPDNLVAACSPCNLRKGARTPDEWRAARPASPRH